jgi:hypothetical protein
VTLRKITEEHKKLEAARKSLLKTIILYTTTHLTFAHAIQPVGLPWIEDSKAVWMTNKVTSSKRSLNATVNVLATDEHKQEQGMLNKNMKDINCISCFIRLFFTLRISLHLRLTLSKGSCQEN